MSITPLLAAPVAIQVHVAAALAAFALGLVQFAAPKGTLNHRTLGWVWLALMATVAISSFWIHEIRLWGPWSPIHIVSIATLGSMAYAALAARRGRVAAHRAAMISLFLGALVITGGFTMLPGRLMSDVAFGG